MAGEHGCGKWLVVGAGRGLLSLAGRFVARLQVVACVHAQATAVRCITVTWHGRVWRLSMLLTPGQVVVLRVAHSAPVVCCSIQNVSLHCMCFIEARSAGGGDAYIPLNCAFEGSPRGVDTCVVGAAHAWVCSVDHTMYGSCMWLCCAADTPELQRCCIQQPGWLPGAALGSVRYGLRGPA